MSDNGTIKLSTQETYNYRSLGGKVVIRGLLPHEAAGLKRATSSLKGERERRGAFLVLALKNAIVTPELSEVEVIDFILEHEKDATKIARRIQALSQGNLKDFMNLRG